MAELVYLCGRGGATESFSDDDLRTIARRILPDNAPYRTDITRERDIVYCLVNGNTSLAKHDTSVCMGQMIPREEGWHRPGTSIPDGTYGIVRADDETVELLTDMTGSRTLFYLRLQNLFVVSTSQRALVHFVDAVDPNETAIAWMVSSGTLGPCQAWDERVEALPPDGRVRLDRSSWDVTTSTGSAWEPFTPTTESRDVHRKRLDRSLDKTFADLDLELTQWALPLSGGHDSREILTRLRHSPSLTTVTWGTDEALETPNSDAVRARELADACNVQHRYYTLPQEPEDLETVFDRFLTAGEGRIDHFQGYTDGFDVFESLAKDGFAGIIRGDEGFGMTHAESETFDHPSEVRQVVGAKMIDDFQSLPSLAIPGTDSQQFPRRYHRRPEESLQMWRDRLYHIYRLPVVLSALTSLKTPYVEVINPFLTREILSTVRSFPVRMRTNKDLFREYVDERSPPVPIATHSPDPDRELILNMDESRRILHANLDTRSARSMVGAEVVDHALEGLSPTSSETTANSSAGPLTTLKRTVGSHVPTEITRGIVRYTPVERVGRTLSRPRLAFRLYLVVSMFEQFEEDVDVL